MPWEKILITAVALLLLGSILIAETQSDEQVNIPPEQDTIQGEAERGGKESQGPGDAAKQLNQPNRGSKTLPIQPGSGTVPSNPKTSQKAQPATTTEIETSLLEQWENRMVLLLDNIPNGKSEREEVDVLYKELSSLLQSKQKDLAALISKRMHSRAVEDLYAEIAVLDDLRIRLLQETTPRFRGMITGFDIEGVQELNREINLIILYFQYKLNMYPLVGERFLIKLKQAPLPMLGKIVQLGIVLIFFYWWRRWAPSGLLRMRTRRLEVRPRQRHDLWVARFLWYFQNVRKPLEWLVIFYCLFSIFNFPEFQEGLSVLRAIVWWILLTWFAVVLINALVGRRSLDLVKDKKTNSPRLRLRSLRLAAVWALIMGLSLGISANLTGKGVLYSWVWRLSIILALPVGVLLLLWWRPEIFMWLEKEPQKPAWAEAALQHQKGVKGCKSAIVGLVYLVISKVRQWIFKGIRTFEGGRQLLANLVHLEASRSNVDFWQKTKGIPIPDQLKNQLWDGKGGIIDDVANKELDRLVELMAQGRGGGAAIIAERGSGKSALLDRLALKSEGTAVLFECPPGGFDSFYRAFVNALGFSDKTVTVSDIQGRIQESDIKLIGIDNLHHLSKPVMGGQSEMDRLTKLTKEISSNILWVFGMGRAAWRYITQIRYGVMLDEVIELPAWTEEMIRDFIEMRCAEADIKPYFGNLVLRHQLDDMNYKTTVERNQAGYYRILWNSAAGNPAVALQLFINSLRTLADGSIVVTFPESPSTMQLERVSMSILLVLRVIIQSGLALQDDIISSLKLPNAEVASAIRFSERNGWIEEIDGRYSLTWKWFRPITRVLSRQNLLFRKFEGGPV